MLNLLLICYKSAVITSSSILVQIACLVYGDDTSSMYVSVVAHVTIIYDCITSHIHEVEPFLVNFC